MTPRTTNSQLELLIAKHKLLTLNANKPSEMATYNALRDLMELRQHCHWLEFECRSEIDSMKAELRTIERRGIFSHILHKWFR